MDFKNLLESKNILSQDRDMGLSGLRKGNLGFLLFSIFDELGLTLQLYHSIISISGNAWSALSCLDCYNPVGKMMDMMALTNSSVNFILYCLMSSQFRIMLRKTFLAKANQTFPSSRKCMLSEAGNFFFQIFQKVGKYRLGEHHFLMGKPKPFVQHSSYFSS